MIASLANIPGLEESEIKKINYSAALRKKEIYKELHIHYKTLVLLYAFASGNKTLKAKRRKYIRTVDDDFQLFETVSNFQKQIRVLEKELMVLIKTFHSMV